MQFLHFFIFPLTFFLLMIILEKCLNDEEFSQMFRLYGVGFIIGIVIKILFSFFEQIFYGKAHHFTIFIKSLVINGLLFSLIIILSFYILIDFLLDISINLNWLLSTFFFLSYIYGIFSSINAIESYYSIYPSSPLFYLCFIPFIILISFIGGLGFFLFIENYKIIIKVISAIFTILLFSIFFMIFNYLRFYNYYEYFYLLIPFFIFTIIFEVKEFRYFRK